MRARLREHLDALKARFPELIGHCDIQEFAGSDYACRIFVGKERPLDRAFRGYHEPAHGPVTEWHQAGETMERSAKLFFLCGKMAAGKSTLAKALAEREQAMLLVSDEWLARLYPEDIVDIPAFVKYSSRLNDALTPLICTLLGRGMSVVLDFPGNTRRQRAWFRQLLDASGVDHELHVIDASDAVCKRQLRARSAGLPEGSRWTTDVEFDAITMHFDPPSPEERFTVIRHERA